MGTIEYKAIMRKAHIARLHLMHYFRGSVCRTRRKTIRETCRLHQYEDQDLHITTKI